MENFLSHTQEDREQMLDVIGIKSADELFNVIPDAAKMPNLPLNDPISEFEASKKLKALAGANKIDYLNFMGGGAYSRYIPAAVSAVTSRFEFLSAYTPYQPEVSQGTLQAMYEFQTYIARICGADVSNSSVYDGATACAEALLASVRINKTPSVWVDKNINPNYLEVIKTYLWAQDIKLTIGENPEGEYSAKLYQFPNYLGELEEIPAKSGKELIIVAVDIFALALCEPPVADFVVGDFGSCGLPVNFGGPYGGFIACKDIHKRQLAGRIIGKTIDKDGKPAFCLTLSAREQHIRREKATSNICSNQAHCALTACVYLSLLGENGFVRVAKKSYDNAHNLAQKLAAAGYEIENKNFFQEFVLKLSKVSADVFLAKMEENGILAGIKLDDNRILIATTEIIENEDIEKYVGHAKSLA